MNSGVLLAALQFRVAAILCERFLMRAFLGRFAVIEDADDIGVVDGGGAVGDDGGGALGAEVVVGDAGGIALGL